MNFWSAFERLNWKIPPEIAIVSYEPDDQVKEKKMITLTQEVIPFYLTKMNVVAKENGGHLVLNRVSFFEIFSL